MDKKRKLLLLALVVVTCLVAPMAATVANADICLDAERAGYNNPGLNYGCWADMLFHMVVWDDSGLHWGG